MIPVAHRRRTTSGDPLAAAVRWLAVVVGIALLVGAAVLLPPSPPVVDRFTVENTGGRAVSIDLRAVDDASVLALGEVPAQGGATFHQVLDLGDELMVALRYGGVSAGEVRVRREALEAGWRVPEAVSAHFTTR